VHGKKVDPRGACPGDDWQRLFANLRAYYAFIVRPPRQKKAACSLGGEFGAGGANWSHDRSLDWHLANDPQAMAAVQTLIRDPQPTFTTATSLPCTERDHDPRGLPAGSSRMTAITASLPGNGGGRDPE